MAGHAEPADMYDTIAPLLSEVRSKSAAQMRADATTMTTTTTTTSQMTPYEGGLALPPRSAA